MAFSLPHLLNLYFNNSLGVDDLLQFALQMSTKQKLPQWLIAKKVARTFCMQRMADFGNRLKTFKADNGVDSGKVSFQVVSSYKLCVTEGSNILTHIIHCSTKDTIEIDPDCHLTDKHVVLFKYDDYKCSLKLRAIPAVEIATFFPQGQGPWTIPCYVCKPKQLQPRCAAIHKSCMDEMKNNKVEDAAGHELKEKVVEAKRVKGVELGKRARASAQMALAKRKARHTE